MAFVVDLNNRIFLLKNLCLFATLSPVELKELAGLFNEVAYSTGDLITEENKIIDSVLVITAGKAEVSRHTSYQGQVQIEILEVLSAGEAIGLDDTGFFSKTALRTATITAITPVSALRMELDVIKKFFLEHPLILSEVQKELDNIMIHTFIKKLEPFAEISHDLLQEIKLYIEVIELPAETIIFRQGDTAECCYLLCSGEIDVILSTAEGSERSIATVEAGELLGEIALFTDSKRNATIKTITHCKLLVIKRKQFEQLVQHGVGASDALTLIMMERHRPLQCEGVTIHRREDAEKNNIVILKNQKNGAYMKTSEEGLFVWQQLDGEHTLQDIAVAYFYQYHKLAIETIGNLVLQLMQSGFVKAPVFAAYIPQTTLPLWMRILAKFRHIMQYEYSIKNVDVWITQLYNRVGFIFFTRTAKFLMAMIAVFGFIVFVGFLPHVSIVLKTIPNAWLLLLLMGPANLLAIPLHELAHALTTKAYGYQVHRLGVGWFWLGPIAFADTSDMWLSTRWPRIAVNLSGIYVNIVISGILVFFAACLPNQTIAVFLWLVALSSYLIAFYNLDPMFELDGYYVLMDVLDKPNLRTHAIKWLIQDFKRTVCSLTLIRRYFPEILYWITSFAFIFLATFMAYILQKYVLSHILPETMSHTHSHYKWLLPLVVIVLSFASLYSKVKQQAYLVQNKIMNQSNKVPK
jgi:putative peptide zinc metalloprotease protein